MTEEIPVQTNHSDALTKLLTDDSLVDSAVIEAEVFARQLGHAHQSSPATQTGSGSLYALHIEDDRNLAVLSHRAQCIVNKLGPNAKAHFILFKRFGYEVRWPGFFERFLLRRHNNKVARDLRREQDKQEAEHQRILREKKAAEDAAAAKVREIEATKKEIILRREKIKAEIQRHKDTGVSSDSNVRYYQIQSIGDLNREITRFNASLVEYADFAKQIEAEPFAFYPTPPR